MRFIWILFFKSLGWRLKYEKVKLRQHIEGQRVRNEIPYSLCIISACCIVFCDFKKVRKKRKDNLASFLVTSVLPSTLLWFWLKERFYKTVAKKYKKECLTVQGATWSLAPLQDWSGQVGSPLSKQIIIDLSSHGLHRHGTPTSPVRCVRTIGGSALTLSVVGTGRLRQIPQPCGISYLAKMEWAKADGRRV